MRSEIDCPPIRRKWNKFTLWNGEKSWKSLDCAPADAWRQSIRRPIVPVPRWNGAASVLSHFTLWRQWNAQQRTVSINQIKIPVIDLDVPQQHVVVQYRRYLIFTSHISYPLLRRPTRVLGYDSPMGTLIHLTFHRYLWDITLYISLYPYDILCLSIRYSVPTGRSLGTIVSHYILPVLLSLFQWLNAQSCFPRP